MEGSHRTCVHQFLQSSLRALAIDGSQLVSVVNAQRLQGGERTAEPRFACDLGLVDCRRKACFVGQASERFPPNALMRRGEQDAVDVKFKDPGR
jgi:hypothetical protein